MEYIPPKECDYMDSKNAVRCAKRVLKGTGCREGEPFLKAAMRLFPGKKASWYVRVVARCLIGAKRLAKYHWLVPGVRELGDRYPFYNVVLTERSEWFCDCFTRAYGWRRRNEICTHAAAVIVLRKTVKRLV